MTVPPVIRQIPFIPVLVVMFAGHYLMLVARHLGRAVRETL